MRGVRRSRRQSARRRCRRGIGRACSGYSGSSFIPRIPRSPFAITWSTMLENERRRRVFDRIELHHPAVALGDEEAAIGCEIDSARFLDPVSPGRRGCFRQRQHARLEPRWKIHRRTQAQRRSARSRRARAVALAGFNSKSRDYQPRLPAMQIGIIGLGYVGLPLAVAFAEAGCDVVGLDVDSKKVEALNDGRSYIEDVPSSALEPLGERLRATSDYAELAELRRGDPLRPHPAQRFARARPHLPGLLGDGAGPGPAHGPARSARVDHLPGHDPRPAAADPRDLRPHRRQRLPSRLLAGADRPGPHRLHGEDDSEAGRRRHRGLDRARPRALRGDLRHRRRPLQPRGGRALEAAGEHLPLGQHRPRQRARPALRPARDRRLGGDRCRRDQAVRVHALRPGPGDGRPLPAGRPLLPRLPGPPARLLPRVHRARRQSQPGAAGLLRGTDRAGAERASASRSTAPASSSSASATRAASATPANRRR